MPWGQPVTPPPAPPKRGEVREWVTVVKLKRGGELGDAQAETIVQAVGRRGVRVEFRTRDAYALGDRLSVQIGPVVREVA